MLAACAGAGVSLTPITQYPEMGLAKDHVVGPRGDTLWTRLVGLVTLASPARRALDSTFVVLESAPQVWTRFLGYQPAPLTAVLLKATLPRERPPARPALPETLAAARPVVWGVYVLSDTSYWGPDTLNATRPPDERLRPGTVLLRLPKRGVPPPARHVEDYGNVFPVEWHVAQQWLDTDLAAHGPLPVWLQAGIVSLVAEGAQEIRAYPLDRGLRDVPPVDSLVGRTCSRSWKPVPGDPPLGFGQVSPTAKHNDPAWAPWLRDRCGYRLRVHAHAVLSFLVESAGPGVVRALVDDARAGRPVEATLARYPGTLPGTRAQLDASFLHWASQRERRGR